MEGEKHIETWYKDYVQPRNHPSTWTSSEVQKHGEALACRQLERLGLEILGQDVLLKDGDNVVIQGVNIIATEGRKHVLVNVVAGVGDDTWAQPKCKITDAMTKAMREAVVIYLKQNPDVQVARHDIASVLIIDSHFALLCLQKSAVELNRANLGLDELLG